jgi:Putative prokaryotic signal transducing protein
LIVSDEIAFLMTAPNEPMARFWEDVLHDAGIPVLVRPGGPGAGGWGSVATFAHDLYVRQDDLSRAREIVAEDADGELGEL